MSQAKSNRIVIDASALLALINKEKGGSKVADVLPNSVMSSINLSEVITISLKLGIEERDLKPLLSGLITEVVDFDQEQAYIAGRFYLSTKKYGLSLGDRACFALAHVMNLPVITADKIWKNVDFENEIIVIR